MDMVVFELVLWTLILILTGFLAFCIVFLVISLIDLESDYVNPIDMCNRCNHLIAPEYFIHGFITIYFLLTGQFLEFLFNLPLLAFHLRNFLTNKWKLDATRIFERISSEKRNSLIKLGFYLCCFFYYLYRIVWILVKDILEDQYGIH